VSQSTGIYWYNITNNTKILLPVPSNTNNNDIAHTQNKLWTSSPTNIKEWNITLNPFSATLNRSLTPPFNLSPGLGAINDTTLIVGDLSTPQKLYELNITTNTPVATLKVTLPASHEVAGDVLLTTTNKLLVLTSVGVVRHLLQYNYTNGSLELDIILGITFAPYGLFQDNGNIYVTDAAGGNIYRVDTVSPYNTTFIQSAESFIFGASQVPSCLTVNFIV
jgi:outer membrane protein assembly factor BamB